MLHQSPELKDNRHYTNHVLLLIVSFSERKNSGELLKEIEIFNRINLKAAFDDGGDNIWAYVCVAYHSFCLFLRDEGFELIKQITQTSITVK